MVDFLKQNKTKYIFGGLFAANFLIWNAYFGFPDRDLHLKIYNVGQGDAIFIESPSGFKILVDGGPDSKVLEHLGKDIPFHSKKIDLMVLTHPDADHLTGLVEVAKQYQIKTIWINGDKRETRVYQEWEKALKDENLTTNIVSQGDKLILPDSTQLVVLWPRKDYQSSQTNNKAIVIQLSYKDFDALLTADADSQVQPYTSDYSHVEVLKVPHHGSKTGMNEEFIKKVDPEVSVISVGNPNRYGHPRPEVINFLETIGSKIYRTDKNGNVEIVTDGQNWYTKTEF